MLQLIERRRCAGWSVAAALFAAALTLPAARAYNPTDGQWVTSVIDLSLALGPADHALQDGSASWDAAAMRAAAEWNDHLGSSRFVPHVDGTAPRQGDNRNTVAFSDTIYGDSFGDETIAVTLLDYVGDTIATKEADVLINRKDTFDSYNGPLRSPGTGRNLDLHRVLLHEFGHVLGLDHPDKAGQKVDAVMNSVISDTDHLTDDDIEGVLALYGDPALHSLQAIAFGLVVDDRRGRIYASAHKVSNSSKGGRLLVIDPYTASVTASVRAGPAPNVLAMSDGGEHLYLGVDGLGVIDQIDPDTLATTQEFVLGAYPSSAPGTQPEIVTAADIAVLPGAPESVLVSQQGNNLGGLQHGYPQPGAADFAVYDQGVLRPQELFTGDITVGTPIILDETGQTIYAFTGGFHVTSGAISRLTLEAGGVAKEYQHNYIGTNELTGGVEYAQGQLFTPDGSVIDLVHGLYEEPFPTLMSIYGRAITLGVDADARQVYYVLRQGDGGDYPVVSVENVAARSVKSSSIHLPRFCKVLKLRRWGANGVLFTLNDGRIMFYRSALIAPGPDTGEPPAVSLQAPTRASLDESRGGTSKLTVTRADGDLSSPLDVHYTLTGAAQNGVDYRALGGVVTIPAGRAKAKIKIVPTGSEFGDGPREVQVQLTPDFAYRLNTASAGTVALKSSE